MKKTPFQAFFVRPCRDKSGSVIVSRCTVEQMNANDATICIVDGLLEARRIVKFEELASDAARAAAKAGALVFSILSTPAAASGSTHTAPVKTGGESGKNLIPAEPAAAGKIPAEVSA